MLFSAVRRSAGVRSLRGASAIARSRHGHMTPSSSVLQSRSLLTSPRVTSYVMARAKVLHLAARSLLAFNQIIELDSASSPLSHYFARNATLRERVYMYLVCLIPPDQPIDLPDFLDGARQAAHVVFNQIYRAHNLDDNEPLSLMEIASDECIAKWAAKLEAQREALYLPVGTKFKLEQFEVHDVRLAGAEYEYTDAAMDQEKDTCSMYHMNEALCMKVRYTVTEHLLASINDGQGYLTRHTVKTTFDWNFYSDVSRARLVDWHITKATPLALEMTTDK